MKQTAVEFLQEALSIHFTFEQKMQFEGLFQHSKELEKQQIIDAFNSGTKTRYTRVAKETFGLDTLPKGIETAEQYFNQTYNK